MTVHFTADLHLYHTNILKFCDRPFKTTEEMNTVLVKNWNQTVQDDDHVYICGDLTLCKSDRAVSILKQLRGTKYLIEGNHDEKCLKNDEFRNCFEWIRQLADIKIPDPDAIREEQHIVLCHFAMRVWNKSHHGSWCLHGHSHGTLKPEGKSVDIGVDSPYITGKREYRPFSYQEVKHFMKNRDIDEKG